MTPRDERARCKEGTTSKVWARTSTANTHDLIAQSFDGEDALQRAQPARYRLRSHAHAGQGMKSQDKEAE